MIKLIHPKTEVIREVKESNHNKRQILKRAGFIPFENYRAPKKPKVVPEAPGELTILPTLTIVPFKVKLYCELNISLSLPRTKVFVNPTNGAGIKNPETSAFFI